MLALEQGAEGEAVAGCEISQDGQPEARLAVRRAGAESARVVDAGRPADDALSMIVAAFLLLRSPAGRVLLLRRDASGDHAHEWALPGGKIREGETAEDAAIRECREELGWDPGSAGKWHCRRVRDGVDATTFVRNVDSEFSPPKLREHDAFMWVDPREALAMGARRDRNRKGSVAALTSTVLSETRKHGTTTTGCRRLVRPAMSMRMDGAGADRRRDDVGQQCVDLFRGVVDGRLVLLDPRLPIAGGRSARVRVRGHAAAVERPI
jgi:8-oxo-dGTP pyrophosphatase MutT (NUDIX family)